MRLTKLTVRQVALLPREERLTRECMAALGGNNLPCTGGIGHYRARGHGVFTICARHADDFDLTSVKFSVLEAERD